MAETEFDKEKDVVTGEGDAVAETTAVAESVSGDPAVAEINASIDAVAAEPDPVVTEEELVSEPEDEPELTPAEKEAARKKVITKNMAGNAGEKQHCKEEVNAGRRDPRSDK